MGADDCYSFQGRAAIHSGFGTKLAQGPLGSDPSSKSLPIFGLASMRLDKVRMME
ncbi:hypothetical protein GCM10010404_70210 [Nonomuraea africana]